LSALRPDGAIPGPTVDRPGPYLDVPPDVTTGCVVVVVGGLVVVVGGLVVVVVAEDWPELDPSVAVVVVDVVGGLVVVVDVPRIVVPEPPGCDVVGTVTGGTPLALAEDPGCSLATVTQMNAVAPPAITIAVLVSRLMRASVTARAVGEYGSIPRLMPVRGGAPPQCRRGRSRGPRPRKRTART